MDRGSPQNALACLCQRARRVLKRLERARVPADIAHAESDARVLIFEVIRPLIAAAIGESGGALDYEDFIKEARQLEDQARELIAD